MIYLQRALAAAEDKLFDQAVEHCKTDDQRMHVLCAQAEMYIDQGNHVAASKVLAKAGISFDEAALRLLGISNTTTNPSLNKDNSPNTPRNTHNNNNNNSDNRHSNNGFTKPASGISAAAGGGGGGGLGGAYVNGPALTALRVYLSETLASQNQSNKSQRTMLATWLCEIYLHQITCASLFPVATKSSTGSAAVTRVGLTSSGGVLQTEAELMAAFKQFLRTYK